MRIDKKTLEDLAIWDKNGGVIHLLDHCVTTGGSNNLKQALCHPSGTYEDLIQIQNAVKSSMALIDMWPQQLNNGMILMVEKFFTATESIINKPNAVSHFIDKIVRKIIPRNEQSLIKFSITQVIDFVKACVTLIEQYRQVNTSEMIADRIDELEKILSSEHYTQLKTMSDNPTYKSLLTSAYYTRRYLKSSCMQAIHIIYQLDYIRSLAVATIVNKWQLPEILNEGQVYQAQNLSHPLLQNPMPYDVNFTQEQNFVFITGANMSGKSTYMKSIGIAAYLAHIGCGVPAENMTISFLNSLITNMQIEDNIYTGESYFLAEVLRMKNTAMQIREQENNLVLMDELFKGTNIHDAYECTETVIKALVKKSNNLYCLSTHLYELGDKLLDYKNIQFKYFETETSADGSYSFSYRLKDGVSNDKIGYLVLKKEGVIEILNT